MQKSFFILFSIYFLLGNMLLPLGDFSQHNYIGSMYEHCKQTEDNDMTVLDFITDHLLNIDCIFDEHKDGDEQKPHNFPKHQQWHTSPNYFCTPKLDFIYKKIKQLYSPLHNQETIYHNLYSFSFYNKIFHPPNHI